MTIRHLYSDVAPVLNLDFANTKRLDPRITFTRSSTGTYVDEAGIIRTAAANQARFDHDTSGNSLGLLIEESRTNLRTYSDITTSTYTSYQNKATIVSSTEIAPDGTVSGVQISNNTGANDQYCWGYFTDYVTVPTTGYICASIFVKMIAGTEIRVQGDVFNQGWIGFAGVKVDFSTETPTVTLTGASGQNAIGGGAIPYPNGWWRIWYYINTADGFNNGQTKAVGVVPNIDGTSACIWGAQIEAGSFPTSYIPTTSSTATRSADVASMTGTNFSSWYNQSEGTLLTNITPHDVTNNDFAYSLSDGTSSERIVSLIGSSYSHYVVDGGSIQAQINYAGYTANTETKAAAAYATNDIAYATDGTVRGTDTSATIPTVDNLVIMANRSNGNHVTGTISRLTYYDRRLTDAQLQALTL